MLFGGILKVNFQSASKKQQLIIYINNTDFICVNLFDPWSIKYIPLYGNCSESQKER